MCTSKPTLELKNLLCCIVYTPLTLFVGYALQFSRVAVQFVCHLHIYTHLSLGLLPVMRFITCTPADVNAMNFDSAHFIYSSYEFSTPYIRVVRHAGTNFYCIVTLYIILFACYL